MALLCGGAGRATAQNGGFRPRRADEGAEDHPATTASAGSARAAKRAATARQRFDAKSLFLRLSATHKAGAGNVCALLYLDFMEIPIEFVRF